jgi:hypothetical protein
MHPPSKFAYKSPEKLLHRGKLSLAAAFSYGEAVEKAPRPLYNRSIEVIENRSQIYASR